MEEKVDTHKPTNNPGKKNDSKGCWGCLLVVIVAIAAFFIISKVTEEPSTGSTENKAAAMAETIVKVNLHTNADVDFSQVESHEIGVDAYDVLGHYTLNGEEHKFDLRLHYKGGEWDEISNWEWSRLQLMRVGQTDLDEDLHGTWTEDTGI